jgi:peptidyl-prolyl cis-trans isomerase C
LNNEQVAVRTSRYLFLFWVIIIFKAMLAHKRPILQISFLLTILLMIPACSLPFLQPSATQTPSPIPATATSAIPTPTMEPQAVTVNGKGISLADFQEELGRFQSAKKDLKQDITEQDARKQVLDDLVDQELLAQAAFAAGFTLDDAGLQARIDQLEQNMGGASALTDWQTRNGYTPESFKRFLRRQAAAAWQRDQIIAAVPQTADQVHARQILVLDSSLADSIYQQLQSGKDFATLALYYDPRTGGELGWFPKGYLNVPEVENAAFSLQPGQYSQVIQTKFGYQIIQVIERDAQHSLTTDARDVLQHQALQQWLTDQRSKSEIVSLLP